MSTAAVARVAATARRRILPSTSVLPWGDAEKANLTRGENAVQPQDHGDATPGFSAVEDEGQVALDVLQGRSVEVALGRLEVVGRDRPFDADRRVAEGDPTLGGV